MTKAPKPKKAPDYIFITVVGLLVIFGLVMLASASSDLAKVDFDDSFFYLKRQLILGVLIGLIGFTVGATVYYHRWKKVATFLLLANVIALLLIFTPLGFTAKGATRWLDLGFFSFQPGELIKLTFLIYIAAWFSGNKKRGHSFLEGFVPFSILLGIVLLLLILQPATTTSVIIFVAALLMYFAAGAKWRFIFTTLLVALLGFVLLIFAAPYRMDRITTFLDSSSVDALDSGYHITQSLIAIGSGGWTGVGYGQSTTKLYYLPEPIGDSIFAVIAEELGFIGAGFLIVLFLVLIWRGLYIARKSQDQLGALLVTGFISIIGLQAFINMASISGVMPLTGVPLPFVSYGGTAMATFLTMSGIIINVSRYRKR